ncbi:MAG: SAM-dependent methyltransferase [Actinomycetes bacterium]|jgi:hypothetical protein
MMKWAQAWGTANAQFYTRERAEDHFTTAPNVSTATAQILAGYAEQLASELETIHLVELGGGNAVLMNQLCQLLDARQIRYQATIVELRPRPANLPENIEWIQGSAPDALPDEVVGLIFAHEFLDDVGMGIAQRINLKSLRHVLVDPLTGNESLGVEISNEEQAWIDQWWPTNQERIEIGLSRDAAWAGIVSHLKAGMAIAIDYAQGTSPVASMMGFRQGVQLRPMPDGSMNLTAHVVIESCAAAVTANQSLITTQQELIDRFFDHEGSRSSAAEQLQGLARKSQWEQARDPSSFGAFAWLIQCVGLSETMSL